MSADQQGQTAKRLYAPAALTERQAEYLYKLLYPVAVAKPRDRMAAACLAKVNDALLAFRYDGGAR